METGETTIKQGPTVPPRARRVPTGPTGPYIIRAPIRDNRAISRAPSGPIVTNQGSDGTRSQPDMARRDPPGLDRSLDYSASVRDRYTDPHGIIHDADFPTGPNETQTNPSSLIPDGVRQRAIRTHRTLTAPLSCAQGCYNRVRPSPALRLFLPPWADHC